MANTPIRRSEERGQGQETREGPEGGRCRQHSIAHVRWLVRASPTSLTRRRIFEITGMDSNLEQEQNVLAIFKTEYSELYCTLPNVLNRI